MSAARDAFEQGVAAFRAGHSEDALQHFSTAIENGANEVAIYDSRAAVLEKLGRHKDALVDSRRVIQIDPRRWQGYARSARLFVNVGKPSAAQTMATLALERIRPEDIQRREELNALLLGIEAVSSKSHSSRRFDHFGNLPVEVAHTIFHVALEEHPSCVVRLASVCRGWRTTLLQNASFWNDLRLLAKNPERKAKLWISRCKGRLRGLHLLGRRDDMMLCLRELKHVSLGHLRSLTITHLSMSDIHSSIPSLTPAVISQLHDVTLSSVMSCPRKFWLWEPESMNLHNLSVNDFQVDWLALSQHCSNLRHISFRGPALNHFAPRWDPIISLLHHNPHMEHLEILVHGPGTVVIESRNEGCPDIVALPHLTKVIIGGSMWHASDVLDRLCLPTLQSLRLHNAWMDTSFSSLVTGGAVKTLQEFSLRICRVDLNELLLFLCEAHNLRSLDMQYCGAVNDVAEALAQPQYYSRSTQEPQVLCPALTHLRFSHSPKLKAGPIVRLVRNRLPPPEGLPIKVAPIASVILDDCPEIDDAVLPWLRSKVSSVSCIYMSKVDAKRRK